MYTEIPYRKLGKKYVLMLQIILMGSLKNLMYTLIKGEQLSFSSKEPTDTNF